MTLKEKENEPWPGHDEAIAELQKWADSIPFIVGDVPEKYQPTLDAIYEGLGIPK